MFQRKDSVISAKQCISTFSKRQGGFTLIEISVVLIIIGLITGGILVGTELIYASRLRQMGTELQKINTAITTFYGKYDCFPGDCRDATTYWGLNSGGCPAGGGATGTCNGNGDGFVCGWPGSLPGGCVLEHLYAWQQLSFAGLIPWSFKGQYITGGTTNIPMIVGQNSPPSTFNSGIGYSFFSVRTSVPTSAYKKTIEIGAYDVNAVDVLGGAGLTAPQAQALDSKFDDALPESGKIYAASGGSSIPPLTSVPTVASPVNSNTNCVSSHAYVTSTSSGCTIEYKPDLP